MDNLIPGLIVVVVTGLVVGGIFWLAAHNKKKRDQALQNLASLNGWVYEAVTEKLSSGYRLHKGDWLIEGLNESTSHSSESSSSSSVSSYTRWFSSAARLPDGIVLIGPRQPDVNLAGMGDFLLQAALRLMIGSDADAAQGIQPVELGSLELMRRCMVWTNRAEVAKNLLDSQVETALLNFPGRLPLVVKFSQAGLEAKVQGVRLYKEQELYALVKLGGALLDAADQVLTGK
jgi:hypothetical protein